MKEDDGDEGGSERAREMRSRAPVSISGRVRAEVVGNGGGLWCFTRLPCHTMPRRASVPHGAPTPLITPVPKNKEGRKRKAKRTHSSISLSHTARDPTQESTRRLADPKARAELLDLRSGEQQHRALSRRLDPRPGDQALVEPDEPAARPDRLERLAHGLRAVRRHLGLDDFEGLPEGRYLVQFQFQVQSRVECRSWLGAVHEKGQLVQRRRNGAESTVYLLQ